MTVSPMARLDLCLSAWRSQQWDYRGNGKGHYGFPTNSLTGDIEVGNTGHTKLGCQLGRPNGTQEAALPGLRVACPRTASFKTDENIDTERVRSSMAVRGSPPPIADNPCIEWVHSGCDGLPGQGGRVKSVGGYLPAIFSAWQFRGSKTPAGEPTGKCLPCSGKPNDVYCAYIFPCFAINTTTGDGVGWGHRDIALLPPWYGANSQACHVHRPDTGNTSYYCDHWLPGKGPQWEHLGWALSQRGGRVDKAAGQLITDPSGLYVMARSPAAIPFANCGPGVTGWVRLHVNGIVHTTFLL